VEKTAYKFLEIHQKIAFQLDNHAKNLCATAAILLL